MDLKIRRAFSILVQEVSDYIHRFGGFDLDLYGLTYESMKDFNELPILIDLAKGIMRYIKANYPSYWNDMGYFFWEHAKIINEQVKILEPIAESMINDEEMDIDEILNQMSTPKVLPDGIDYKKYNNIFDQLKLPNAMFQYIFVCENILRKFIIQVLDENGYPLIDSIGNAKLTKSIQDRKKQEAKQNYLPIRGDHDIYYLDLIELNRIIAHKWKDCFEDKFEDQDWIIARIKSLYSIRNRVAHSSSLTSDELKSVETYCREIIKQIDTYIK
ncbi:MAG: Swt1 family HEPN domain-containing protein [Candidatus Helarchaeota archaeon]